MKVCLITMHKVPNYGSVLQTYATCKVIEDLGHRIEVLDYIPKRLKLWNTVFTEAKNKNSKILFPVYFTYSALVNIPKRFMYNRFLKKYIKLSPRQYYNNKEVQEYLPEADIFITGSDQVWNTYYDGFIDLTFFLNFVPKNKKKISYAASFGDSNIDDKEAEIIRPHILSYDALSVRESSGIKIINEIGRNDVEHVLDPTLLLTKEQWGKLFSSKKFNEKYILMYTVNKDEDRLIQFVMKIAKAKGLKIYYIHNGLKSIEGCDRIFRNQSPNDFLSLFVQAEYVIATSFHGTAFAINFNKPFISILPEKFKARVRSILQLVGLEERMIGDNFSLETALKDIDYDRINQIIKKERQKSYDFLNMQLR